MKDIELAKYWYYRLIKSFTEENFKLSHKLGWQKNELEIFLKSNINNFRKNISVREYIDLRLRIASNFGNKLKDFIPTLKVNEYKYIWNKSPDGLTFYEFIDKMDKSNSDINVIQIRGERLEDYIDNYKNIDTAIKNLERDNRELIHIIPSIEQFSKNYDYEKQTCIEGTNEILDDFEYMLSSMEPPIIPDFEQFLVHIGIDYSKSYYVHENERKIYEKTITENKKLINFPIIDSSGLEWKDLSIELMSMNSIRVVIKKTKYSKRFEYAELGMKDGRKGDLPNKLWNTLVQFGKYNGLFENLSFTGRGKLEKTISRLRVHLRNVFGLEGDPIPFIRKNRSYRTSFNISDKNTLL